MQYRNLGRSGMKVSSLCLGTMNFGRVTEQDEAIRIVHTALDGGINFIDTADWYSAGTSEEMIGQALADRQRDQVVLATKFTTPMGKGPNDGGSSRYHMIRACEASLRRLRTDCIDLYQIHWMDLSTPLDEVLRALDDLVRQGKIIYTGCSKHASAYIAEAMMLCRQAGWMSFISEQPPYSLLDRTIENEVVWTCQRFGLGIITWAPLGGGILAGKYAKDQQPPPGSRYGAVGGNRLHQQALDIAEEVKTMASEKGVEPAVLSTAWVMNQPGITAPIIGPRTVEHVNSSLKALDVQITDEDRKRLDEIAPPGSAVSNFYDVNVYQKLRVAAGIQR